MAAPVMPVSLSVSQFLLFFDCFYSGGGASRQERQSLSFFGDLWRGMAKNQKPRVWRRLGSEYQRNRITR